jgi:hypothetical protein
MPKQWMSNECPQGGTTLGGTTSEHLLRHTRAEDRHDAPDLPVSWQRSLSQPCAAVSFLRPPTSVRLHDSRISRHDRM